MFDLRHLPGGLNGTHDYGQPNGNGHALSPDVKTAPRILVPTVSAGTGHLRAAEAVELAVRRMVPGAYVQTVDIMDLATAPFRRCYGQMYVDFIDLAPSVLGFFYDLMDKPCPPGLTRWDRLRISLERMSLRPFVYLLQSGNWDLIISTHFLAGEIIGALRREKRVHFPHVMVTTDFETHKLWVNQPCEHYFTADSEAAAYLETYGVPHGDAMATGIPIHPVFSEPKDRAACLARQGLRGDRPIILQMTGGFGVGPIKDLYEALLAVETPLDVVLLTGRNERAKKEMEALAVPARHRVHVLGYTRQIDELMRVADLAVTKPGGLTTSELLALGTPMVIVDPVPGQEERNSDYLLENGAALKVNHLPTLAHKVEGLLRDPNRLAQMRAKAHCTGRPRAAFDVVARSLAIMNRWPAPPARNSVRVSETPPDHSAEVTAVRPASEAGRLTREWRASQSWFDLFELEVMHLFARLWHGCSSAGPPPLPPTGPALVVANHPNYCDPAFLLGSCNRPLCFMQAAEQYRVPLLRRLFARVGCIPVTRSGQDLTAVRAALRRLAEGEAVCVFPEGEVESAGSMRPAHTGAAFLALRSRAPVYPAWIAGGPRSGSLLRDWLWPSRGARVIFGPPLDLSAYYDRPINHRLLREVTDRIMQGIACLKPTTASPAPPHQAAMALSG